MKVKNNLFCLKTLMTTFCISIMMVAICARRFLNWSYFWLQQLKSYVCVFKKTGIVYLFLLCNSLDCITLKFDAYLIRPFLMQDDVFFLSFGLNSVKAILF